MQCASWVAQRCCSRHGNLLNAAKYDMQTSIIFTQRNAEDHNVHDYCGANIMLLLSIVFTVRVQQLSLKTQRCILQRYISTSMNLCHAYVQDECIVPMSSICICTTTSALALYIS